MADQLNQAEQELLDQARDQRAAAFLQWQQDPVTIRFFQFLRDKKDEHAKCWLNGDYIGETAEQTQTLNNIALGKSRILDELIRLEPEDLEK